MSWTGFEITSEPSTEPVTTAEVKTELRLTTSAHDTMIDNKIAGARIALEGELQRQFITATYKAYWSCFNNRMELPYGPVQSITSITYIDGAGDTQTLSSSVYRLDDKSIAPWIGLEYNQSWPTARDVSNTIIVTYVAGYGAASAVPMPIKLAIIALAADLYEHPEYSPEIALHQNQTVQKHLSRFKRVSW